MLDCTIEAYALIRYRFGTLLAAFLIGYYVFSHERVQKLIEQKSMILSIVAILSTIERAIYLIVNKGRYTNIAYLRHISS